MKEILTRVLKLIGEQQKASARLIAETTALKAVMSALGPEVKSILEEQMEKTRGRVQILVLDSQIMRLEALEKEVAKMAEGVCPTDLTTADFHAEMYTATKQLEARIEMRNQNERTDENDESTKQFVPRSTGFSAAAAFTFPGLSPGC
jgi:hypothetical protein